MSQENIDLCHRWFEEVWNKGRAEAVDELFAEDGLAHGLAGQGGEMRGPSGFKPFLEQLRSAFPDIHITVEDTVAAGDKVAVRWVATMTHKGEMLGVAATAKQATVTGISIVRIADGKIAEGWNNWDLMGLMQQIGMVPVAKLL